MHWGNLHFATLVMNLFCIPFGMYGLILGGYSYFWIPEEAKIITSEEVTISSGNGWDKQAKIEYIYKVGSETYTANTVEIRPRLSTKNRRVELSYLEQYKLGDNVTVFYSESWPNLSTLVKGVSNNTVIVILFSLGLIFVGSIAKKRSNI